MHLAQAVEVPDGVNRENARYPVKGYCILPVNLSHKSGVDEQ